MTVTGVDMNRDGIPDVATASGWLWCTLAVWSAAKVWVDDDCDWRGHEQGRHSRRVATASGWLQRSCAVWSACGSSSHFPDGDRPAWVPVRGSSGGPVRCRSHGHQEEEGCVLLKAFKDCIEQPSLRSDWISL